MIRVIDNSFEADIYDAVMTIKSVIAVMSNIYKNTSMATTLKLSNPCKVEQPFFTWELTRTIKQRPSHTTKLARCISSRRNMKSEARLACQLTFGDLVASKNLGPKVYHKDTSKGTSDFLEAPCWDASRRHVCLSHRLGPAHYQVVVDPNTCSQGGHYRSTTL